MSLLRDILAEYLYYDEVQRLAAEHGLPVSRTKEELVDELVESGALDPGEVVAFLRVDDLREICSELGIPSGASRGVLADRVAGAIRDEERPRLRKKKPRPALPAALAPPSSSPDMDQSSRPELSRASWWFVGIVFTVIFAAAVPLSVYLFGAVTGSLLVLGAGLVTAVVFGVTMTSWSDWVDRRFRRGP